MNTVIINCEKKTFGGDLEVNKYDRFVVLSAI